MLKHSKRTKLSLTCREAFWIRKASAIGKGAALVAIVQRWLWALRPHGLEAKGPLLYANLHIVLCALLTHINVWTLASWLTAAHFRHLLAISNSLVQSYWVQIQSLTLGGI